MPRPRIAVIGLGVAAAPHLKSLADLSDRVEVAAVYSPSADRRNAVAAKYGLPAIDDLDAVFADPSIDAVLILTPPNTHLDLVARAAAAGKHILLEKPLEVSLARSEALVEAAREAGVTLAMVLQLRFRPAVAELAGLIGSGRLGTIVSASAQLRNWRPQSYYDQPGRGTLARDGGGVLLTQAIHTLDLLISLAGLPTEVSAYATTTPIHSMETEDLVVAAVRFENGAIGTIQATTTAYPGFPDRIEIVGTLGTASLTGEALAAHFHDGMSVETGAETAGGAGADPMAFSHGLHRALISDFLDALETGRPPKIRGADALMAHDLIEAILSSSAAGLPQRVRRR